jgi:hypothetical protein
LSAFRTTKIGPRETAGADPGNSRAAATWSAARGSGRSRRTLPRSAW